MTNSRFFQTEPIVYCLSALSACGDAIVFLFMEVFGHIYGEHFGFDKGSTGLMFIPLALGCKCPTRSRLLCLVSRH